MSFLDSPTLPLQDALALAKENIAGIEAGDVDRVRRTLAADVSQLFMHTTLTRTPDGARRIVTGAASGFCVADFRGRDEVLAYTEGLIATLSPRIWRDSVWSVSSDGRTVFMRAEGDMAVAATGAPYRNSYVTRFDVRDGAIVAMVEYANAFLYAGLRQRPTRAQLKALLRATRHVLAPGRATRLG